MTAQSKLITILQGIFVGYLWYLCFLLVTKTSTYLFIDNANLGIHEAGHLLLSPFGEFVHFLGGTIAQLVVPLAFAAYFWFRKEHLSWLFCFFWFGESLVNVAHYMSDAPYRLLPLFGGGQHDWYYIFSHLHVLHIAEEIGFATFLLGCSIMVISLFVCSIVVASRLMVIPVRKT